MSCGDFRVRPEPPIDVRARLIFLALSLRPVQHAHAHQLTAMPCARRKKMSEKWLKKSNVVEQWKTLAAKSAAIPALEFAECSLTLISVFDLINGMSIASSDMIKNATTIKTWASGAGSGKTLQEAVASECADKSKIKSIAGDGKTVTCALLWLTRALYFILKMLEPLVNDPSKKLSECVLAGYGVSLKPHHGFMIKTAFNAAVTAAPARDKFLLQLADSEAEVKAQIDDVTPSVAGLLTTLNTMLKEVDSKYLTAYE